MVSLESRARMSHWCIRPQYLVQGLWSVVSFYFGQQLAISSFRIGPASSSSVSSLGHQYIPSDMVLLRACRLSVAILTGSSLGGFRGILTLDITVQ
jgi:hypothetical protein